MHRIDVGAHNRIFEPVGLPDELARVYIDGDQCFGLIDDNIATRFEPHLRSQCFLDLGIQSVLFKNRRVL